MMQRLPDPAFVSSVRTYIEREHARCGVRYFSGGRLEAAGVGSRDAVLQALFVLASAGEIKERSRFHCPAGDIWDSYYPERVGRQLLCPVCHNLFEEEDVDVRVRFEVCGGAPHRATVEKKTQ